MSVSIGHTRASRLDLSLDSECSVFPSDIQVPNSTAIATPYFNSNLSMEMCSNCWLLSCSLDLTCYPWVSNALIEVEEVL